MNKLGKKGEDTAVKYLEKMNYKILKRNYKNRKGEIDIIAYYNGIIAIIEVKTRSNNKFGYPIDAVNGIKVNRIKECTKYYLYKEKVKFSAIRFDVIEIYKIKEQYVVNHIKMHFKRFDKICKTY